jgi:exopolyphosphatase/pppGpp-phosphohydrolase
MAARISLRTCARHHIDTLCSFATDPREALWKICIVFAAAHARHVANLALQLYDGLPVDGILRDPEREVYRHILQAAVLMHDVGDSRTKDRHKASARLIRKLDTPMGWTSEEIHITALVARYHRGALPRETQRSFAALTQSKRQLVQFLGGILRLACACDRQHDGQIRRVEVEGLNPVLTIRADGYTQDTSLAEYLAAARHLLELACHRPVFILPSKAAYQAHAA